MRIWDANIGECLAILTGPNSEIVAVAFDRSGKWVYWQNTMRWVLQGHENGDGILPTTLGHKGAVNCLSFDCSGKWVVSGGDDNVIHLWDAETGKLIKSFEGDTKGLRGVKGVKSVSFDSTGKRIVSKSEDGTLHIWDVSMGKALHVFKHPEAGDLFSFDAIEDFLFESTKNWIIVKKKGGTLGIWDINKEEFLHTRNVHTEEVKHMLFEPTSKSIVSAGDDKTLKVWCVETDEILNLDAYNDENLEAKHFFTRGICRPGIMSLDSSGKRLVCKSHSGKLKIWNIETGKVLHLLEGETEAITAILFDPTGQRIAAKSYDDTVQVWNANTGKFLWCAIDVGKLLQWMIIHKEQGIASSISFDPTGKWLVSGSYDGIVRIWDSDTGKLLDLLEGHTEAITSVSFNSISTQVASAGNDKSIVLWKLISEDPVKWRVIWRRSISSQLFCVGAFLGEADISYQNKKFLLELEATDKSSSCKNNLVNEVYATQNSWEETTLEGAKKKAAQNARVSSSATRSLPITTAEVASTMTNTYTVAGDKSSSASSIKRTEPKKKPQTTKQTKPRSESAPPKLMTTPSEAAAANNISITSPYSPVVSQPQPASLDNLAKTKEPIDENDKTLEKDDKEKDKKCLVM